MKELMASGIHSTIEIYKSAYPGVHISICGCNLTIDRVYKKGTFYLKDNVVQFAPR